MVIGDWGVLYQRVGKDECGMMKGEFLTATPQGDHKNAKSAKVFERKSAAVSRKAEYGMSGYTNKVLHFHS